MPPKYPCKRIDLLFGITMTIRADKATRLQGLEYFKDSS
jgi:hypothetical protein